HDTPDLFRTVPRNKNHWLAVRLVGTRSNRSAIGARVRAWAGGTQQTQEVRGGGSYASQNDFRVHFGLGKAERVERLAVRWPNGLEEEWRDVAADRVLVLKEGGGQPSSEAPRPSGLQSRGGAAVNLPRGEGGGGRCSRPARCTPAGASIPPPARSRHPSTSRPPSSTGPRPSGRTAISTSARPTRRRPGSRRRWPPSRAARARSRSRRAWPRAP